MNVWNYIDNCPVKIDGDTITMCKVTRKNHVYYTTEKEHDKILRDLLIELSPNYFGFDAANVLNNEASLWNYKVIESEKPNQIMWQDSIFKFYDDATVELTNYNARIGHKDLNYQLQVSKDNWKTMLNFIRRNREILSMGQLADWGDIIQINNYSTDKKQVLFRIKISDPPKIYAVAYLEGVYNVSISYDTDIEKVVRPLRKPAIRGARKLFGPPNWLDFDNVKKIIGSPEKIAYIFDEKSSVIFKNNKTVIIKYGYAEKIIPLDEATPIITGIFATGDTSVVMLL